jgi:hypothetical protein
MARFYDGQPVVCVKGGSNPNAERRYPGLRWPVKGRRYTIRLAEVPIRDKITFVLVQGISNRVIRWPCGTRYEAGFWEDRFEPATDIGELEKARDATPNFFRGGDDDWDHRVKRKVRKKEDA